MKTTTYTAELGTDGSTPALAVSILRGRIGAVEVRTDYVYEGNSEQGRKFKPVVTQVGVASDFHLREIDGRLALVCRVELDDDRHDAIKHLLTDGGARLHVGEHPIIAAVGP